MNIKIIGGLILSVIFLVVVSLTTPVTVAQVQDEIVEDDFSTYEATTIEPDLFVDYISLVENELTTGGNISGTFSIYNTGEQTASDVKYRVDLLSVIVEDQNIYPISLINSSNLNTVGVVSPGEKKLQFSYNIPDSLPKDTQFAISVIALVGEEERAREDELVVIGGNLVDYIEYSNSSLSIGDEEFFLKEGPTVSSGEKIQLNTTLNSTQNITNITSVLKVFSGVSQTGDIVYETSSELFDLTANLPTEKTFELPTELNAGVYTAILSLHKEGQDISEILEMRYIVGGEDLKPKIADIDFNNLDQNAIDKFIVSISYLDIPINYRLDENGNFVDPKAGSYFIKDIENITEEALDAAVTTDSFILPQNLSVEVSLYDAKTNKIIDTQITEDLSSLTNVEFMPIRDYDEVKVVTSLKESGEIIDVKEIFLQINPKDGGWAFLDMFFSNPKFAGVAGAVLLFVILVIIGFASYLKKNKNVTALSIVLVGCLVAGSIFIFGGAEKVVAGTVWLTNTEIQSPKPPAVRVYSPGESVQFRAKVNFTYCNNEWFSAKGKISEPVLKGLNHKNFGPLTGSSISLLSRSGDHKNYLATYTTNFVAPQKPGVYWFKYYILVSNGEGTGKTQEGVVQFRVQGPDVCTNIGGVQEEVPTGLVRVVREGKPVCVKPSGNLICEASKSKLQAGESVTYTAKSNANGNFSWYEGLTTSGETLKTQNSVTQSTYTTSYESDGMYQVSVLVNSAGGVTEKCIIGVTVGDVEGVPVNTDYGSEPTASDAYTLDDGSTFHLNPNAANGKIKLELDGSITNTTCKAVWTTENVFRCRLYQNNVLFKTIPTSGSENFGYGTYQIGCDQTRDAAEVRSVPVTCRQNPDFREL